ncbi:HPr family phosphocarrier protein [Salibacterium qingdaonense]|uniref:Catabolite repression HPr-like protein n=1 Tax=Salibacterium qingdaonense TaxID=266892 RepID=A0A1I4KW60_9BACI|nr:HPr family phosphocarrier protein [Salibacterium qingdaonense]SFL83024.1 catabolite repression HPr-like protein [Salibacterium qingdaonense]
MIEKKAEVKLKTGLQARPAALFVQEANRFQSNVFIEKEDKKVNAKSIMGIMSLAARTGETIKFSVDGEDEQEAVEELARFVEKEE